MDDPQATMTEPQQSPLYAQYMKLLKWDVITIDATNIFIKRLPLLGTMAKIHRPEKLPSLTKLIPFLQSHAIRRLTIEPASSVTQPIFTRWYTKLPSWVQLNRFPFLPTKTIRIDLKKTEEQLFHELSEAKRRAVRRATKLGVVVHESQNIRDLIRIKNKSAGMFGFITTTGLQKLWDIFSPKNTTVLLARQSGKVIGGVFLLFWDQIAYYWIAGATMEGKKQFAPTLLAWEAIKLSKGKKLKFFDFVGVWDERMPKQNRQWLGFTKFKEGFGGEKLYYPLVKTMVTE